MSHRPASRSLPRLTLLAALGASALATAPAGAQQARLPDHHLAGPASARADALESRLAILLRTPETWREAARVQHRVAELRGDDPRAIDAWERAAWFYTGTEEHGMARRMMERVADRAAAAGDTARAAGALIDAAFAAVADERPDIARALVRRARPLIDAPSLTRQQRLVLLERIDGPTLVALRYTGR